MSQETPYTETEALVAVMQADIDHAQELLAGFLPRELDRFLGQIMLLEVLIYTQTMKNETEETDD